MQVSLIDIGTSKGVRIPSTILKIFDSVSAFDLEVKKDRLVLKAIKSPRKGWEEKFKNNPNELLINDTLDSKDWDEI